MGRVGLLVPFVVSVMTGVGGCAGVGATVASDVSSAPASPATATATMSDTTAAGAAQIPQGAGESSEVPTDVTVADLRSAVVPANCDLPEQRLVDGLTTQGAAGRGGMGPDNQLASDFSVSVDMAGLGYKQRLGVYGCTAGGVSRPETLVLVGHGGEKLASFDLADLGKSEHVVVTSMQVRDNRVLVGWSSYQGAGSDRTSETTQFRYAGQGLHAEQAPARGAEGGQTLDASSYDVVDFASPSGRIQCSMSADGVACMPPLEVLRSGALPSKESVCPDGDLQVNTLTLADGKAGWGCWGGVAAYPVVGSEAVEWNRSGFGQVARVDGYPSGLVTLPYGKNITWNDYTCSSREDGVTCRLNGDGPGFKVARAGVTFY